MKQTPYPVIAPPSALSVGRETARHPEFVRAHEGEAIVSVGHYVWLLRRAWWKIALATVLCTSLASFVSYHLTPVYEATARLSVDPQLSNTVMGESASTNLGGGAADQFFNTQIELVQSDAVLRPVAEQFGLMTKQARDLPPGMKAADAQVSLRGLSVVHPPNSFLIDINYRSVNPVMAAAVANAVTQSFRQHSQTMRASASMEESDFIKSQLSELKKRMDDSERALASYETQLGVINPDEKTSILEARLQALNTAYTEAQSDRMRKQVDLRAFQTGSTAALEVSPQAMELSKTAETVHAAQEKMQAAAAVYGSANPEYKRAASALAEATRQYNSTQADVGKRIQIQFDEASHREQLIGITLMATKSQFDTLNAHSVQYQELKREAEANKTLYAELSRKVQEAGINAAFQGSDIRIADEARPHLQPVFPNKITFIGLGFFLSMVGSILTVLLADMTDKSLRDPGQTRREMGLEVIGILPMVKDFGQLAPVRPRSLDTPRGGLVKAHRWFGTVEFYEETVSSLLTTVRLGRFSHPLRSILVTSAAQGEGKSSCIAHLAAAHARQGYRTLLIDADLRCPTQQRYFDLPLVVGLADAVVGSKTLKELRQSVPGNPQLDVILAGHGNHHVTERLGKVVDELMKEAYREYDLIFLDAPPMLFFAETLHLASVADGVLVICQAGRATREQVTGVLATLQQLGSFPLGLVLNQVRERMSSHYGQYRRYYRTLKRPEKAA